MDTGKSFEDKFSKLHPSLPLNTRFGIIGGGPSGLSAAYALAKLGYNEVTVLEKNQDVGGMCESVEIEGTTYLILNDMVVMRLKLINNKDSLFLQVKYMIWEVKFLLLIVLQQSFT